MSEGWALLGFLLLIFAAGVSVGDVVCRRAHKRAIDAHKAMIAEAASLRKTRAFVGPDVKVESSSVWRIGPEGLFRVTITDVADA